MVVLIDDGCTKLVQQILNCASGKFGTAEYCIGGTVRCFDLTIKLRMKHRKYKND